MLHGLNLSGSSMLARATRQDVIANNIANSDVPGFKRDGIFLKELGEARRKGSGGYPVWRENRIAGAYIDLEQGSLRQTNSPRHLAIQGPGFFQVRTPQGDVYTRNGEFSVNRDGILVTNLGQPVLDETGREIRLESADFTINEDGQIFQAGEAKGTIAIHDFEKDAEGHYQDPDGVTRLERKQNGFLVPKPGINRVPKSPQTKVVQGFLEESNVNPIVEMVDMVTLFRSYEADQRVIRAQDDTLRRAVSDVGSIR
ncbi:MAG: flagellar hook-basal body protein [Candidatus Latescibacteria bacterium]|jgi:flagellar basal-body rod protein FlgG|nr:flagellar hook-basal body protein [Candidatus Latescibacterota bacterium]